ncbi:NAD(P)H-dependent oxidoreductase [Undibacterium arcticum]
MHPLYQQENTTTRIIGITGCLRSHSYNTALLRAAAALVPDGATLEVAILKGILLYDGDIEQTHGIPSPVTALKELIAGADGVLLATPEYNSPVPGVFKNAIDWDTKKIVFIV